jgi:hypothetical protein
VYVWDALARALSINEPVPNWTRPYLQDVAVRIKRRIKAWKIAHHLPLDRCIGIYIVPQPIYLMDRASTRAFLEDVLLRLKPVAIIGDTWARCLAGADENSAQDIGEAIGALDMWRRETGAANIWITHRRADERRERGSSALRGAADTMISMLPTDDVVSLRCDTIRKMPSRSLRSC